MAGDYIRRDLAKKRFSKRLMWLKEDVHDEYSGALLDGCETDIELLDEIPAADVAEVVRCKDCEYGDYDSKPDGAMVCLRTKDGFWRKETDFCSYGTPKNDGGET